MSTSSRERMSIARTLAEAANGANDVASTFDLRTAADEVGRIDGLEAEIAQLARHATDLKKQVDDYDAVCARALRIALPLGYKARMSRDPLEFIDDLVDELVTCVRTIGHAHRTGAPIDPDDLRCAADLDVQLAAADAAHRLAK